MFAVTAMQDDLPKGIVRVHKLPDPALNQLWDSIVLDEAVKHRLVAQALTKVIGPCWPDRAIASRATLPSMAMICPWVTSCKCCTQVSRHF